MKTIYFIIPILFISTFSNYPQKRTRGADGRTDNNSYNQETKIKEVHQTPIPENNGTIRDTPHNSPNREPVNADKTPVAPPIRATVPPSSYINPPDPGGIIFAPLPYFDNPPVEETYYTEPITPVVIGHNYKELGLSQYKEGKYYEALESFQLASAKDTLDYLLYYYMGATEIELERYDDAVLDLTIFIDNVIENRQGFYQRGLANFYLGNKDAAFDDLIVADRYQVDGAKVILKRFYDYY